MASSRGGWSEARVHRWLFGAHRPRGLATRFGQDAAVLSRALRRPVLCADQCIEGVHFEPGTSGRLAGRKAASRALSDLAATAASPRALLFSASLPPEAPEAWIRAAILAVAARARDFGAELVGGDLACSAGPCVLSVAALGEFGARGTPPARDRLRPGDFLFLSGPCGGSLLGRHLRIEPRVAEGRQLWQRGAHAITDVSDGLARDLGRLAQRSGVALEIERVPIHRDARRLARSSGQSALEHALYDGEDYELIAALPAARARAFLASAQSRGWFAIGRARAGAGVLVPREEDSSELVPIDPKRGWNHGRG